MTADPTHSPALGALARSTAARAQVATLRWDGEEEISAAAQLHVDGRGCLLLLLAAADPVVGALATHPVLTVEVPAPDPYGVLALEGVAHRIPVGAGAAFRLAPSALTFRGGAPRRVPGGAATEVEVGVPVAAYFAASPEPTWAAGPSLLEHLGAVHGAALTAFLRGHGMPAARLAVPTALTSAGLDLSVVTADGVGTLRLGFREPAEDVGRAVQALGRLLGCAGCPAGRPHGWGGSAPTA